MRMQKLSAILMLVSFLYGQTWVKGIDNLDSLLQQTIKIGEIYQSSKHYTIAIRFYLRLLKKYPDTSAVPLIKFKLAECYEDMKNYEDALKLYEELEQVYPEREEAPLALLRKVHILNTLKRYDEALKSIDEFLNHYPNRRDIPFALLMKGETLQHKGDIEKAEAVYKALINQFPSTDFSEKAFTKLEEIWKNRAVTQYIHQEKQALKKWLRIYTIYALYLVYKNREYL